MYNLITVDDSVFPFDQNRLVDFGTVKIDHFKIEVAVKYCEYSNVAFLHQRPENYVYADLYEKSYHQIKGGIDHFTSRRMKTKMHFRLSLILEMLKNSKITFPNNPDILDFGSGSGTFVREFQAAMGGVGVIALSRQHLRQNLRKTKVWKYSARQLTTLIVGIRNLTSLS